MKIVCLGDSLTTGYNLAPGEGWVDLLNRETPHLWVNAGVAGDTSTGLLVRLQSQALPQKPDMVLFMGGDNDIMLTGSADQAKSAVMAMVHQCVPPGSGRWWAFHIPCAPSRPSGSRCATWTGLLRPRRNTSGGCAG